MPEPPGLAEEAIAGGLEAAVARAEAADPVAARWPGFWKAHRLLAYYRTAWAVQDIAAYGEEVLLTPALGQETRRAALEGLMDLFEPGNIVDLANRFAGRFGPG